MYCTWELQGTYRFKVCGHRLGHAQLLSVRRVKRGHVIHFWGTLTSSLSQRYT